MIQQFLGFEWAFSGDKYVLAILSTFIFVYGGHPFLKGLYDEVKDNAIGMMTLIGVAITVAWAYSVPGEKIPVDGIVIEGESYIDESMLTGESKPVKKEKDRKVIGGAVNSEGSLTIKVVCTEKDSYLNKVVKLVEDAQKIKSKTQNFADRAAKILTFVALGGGFLTLPVWLVPGFPFVLYQTDNRRKSRQYRQVYGGAFVAVQAKKDGGALHLHRQYGSG